MKNFKLTIIKPDWYEDDQWDKVSELILKSFDIDNDLCGTRLHEFLLPSEIRAIAAKLSLNKALTKNKYLFLSSRIENLLIWGDGPCPKCGGHYIDNFGDFECVVCGYEPSSREIYENEHSF